MAISVRQFLRLSRLEDRQDRRPERVVRPR